VNANCFGTC